MELNLAREVRRRKGFIKYIIDKTNTRGSVGPLLKVVAVLVAEDKKEDKATECLLSLCLYSWRLS